MYLAVLIARLVGLHIAHSQKRTLTEKFTGVVPPNSIYLFVVTWGCPDRDGLRITRCEALMEAQLIVAVVAQKYRLDLVPGYPVEPEAMMTLQRRHGVMMTMHKQSTQR